MTEKTISCAVPFASGTYTYHFEHVMDEPDILIFPERLEVMGTGSTCTVLRAAFKTASHAVAVKVVPLDMPHLPSDDCNVMSRAESECIPSTTMADFLEHVRHTAVLSEMGTGVRLVYAAIIQCVRAETTVEPESERIPPPAQLGLLVTDASYPMTLEAFIRSTLWRPWHMARICRMYTDLVVRVQTKTGMVCYDAHSGNIVIVTRRGRKAPVALKMIDASLSTIPSRWLPSRDHISRYITDQIAWESTR